MKVETLCPLWECKLRDFRLRCWRRLNKNALQPLATSWVPAVRGYDFTENLDMFQLQPKLGPARVVAAGLTLPTPHEDRHYLWRTKACKTEKACERTLEEISLVRNPLKLPLKFLQSHALQLHPGKYPSFLRWVWFRVGDARLPRGHFGFLECCVKLK